MITYRTHNGYQIPNLTVPEEQSVTLGKYGLLRKRYLKQHRRVLFVNLLTAGTLNAHLTEVEQTANEQMELTVAQMAAAQGVTERLKAENQMEWAYLRCRYYVETKCAGVKVAGHFGRVK